MKSKFGENEMKIFAFCVGYIIVAWIGSGLVADAIDLIVNKWRKK